MREPTERESDVCCARRTCENQLSARATCVVPAVHAIYQSARVACGVPAVHARSREPTERKSGVWCARRACENQLSARVACGVPAVHAIIN